MHAARAAILILAIFIAKPARAVVEERLIGSLAKCRTELLNVKDPTFIIAMQNTCRFVKSARWGWVDFKHFGSTGKVYDKLGDRWFPNTRFLMALVAGETHEQIYRHGDGEIESYFSYEDLTSNFLGASFANMFERGLFAQKSYSQALIYFLKSIEIEENPSAPGKLRKNRTYVPVANEKTSAAMNNWVQRELNRLRFLAIISLSGNQPMRGWLLRIEPIAQKARDIEKRL